MRDIRDDLKARRANLIGSYADDLHRLDGEFERLLTERRKVVQTFQKAKATIEAMLDFEEKQHSDGVKLPAAMDPPLSLRDFIIARIENGGPIEKERLYKQAIQAGFSESGRTFNMTLQNVANGGRIKKLPDGRFATRETVSLFAVGETPMTTQ